ncbi:cytochrome c oxidase subunit 4 [Agilicoccus flavus]|uniref:cytochrome c oxidase subunit 4 n=1 Tax=Agilicoccus flavus TaxID=2775968 RepID=UPI001CF6B50A|nr:cytochrome c oxidase subunit 4 [Agilicoccus flavus]
MKVSSGLFLAGVIAFTPVAIIYGFWSNAVDGRPEPVGVVCLALLAVMSGMIGVYIRATGKRLDVSPSDVPDGDIDQAAGDYGFFSPYSWWPLPLGLAALMLFLGLAIGWWVFVVGAIFGIVALVGWAFEYFTGDFA